MLLDGLYIGWLNLILVTNVSRLVQSFTTQETFVQHPSRFSPGCHIILIYTTPLSKVIGTHSFLKFHLYTDDTQLFIHLTHKNVQNVTQSF